jgi:hypothetical protein
MKKIILLSICLFSFVLLAKDKELSKNKSFLKNLKNKNYEKVSKLLKDDDQYEININQKIDKWQKFNPLNIVFSQGKDITPLMFVIREMIINYDKENKSLNDLFNLILNHKKLDFSITNSNKDDALFYVYRIFFNESQKKIKEFLEYKNVEILRHKSLLDDHHLLPEGVFLLNDKFFEFF